MKKSVLIFATILMFFCGCKSKLDKVVDKAHNLSEEYVDALNNAETVEEVKMLKQEFKSKGNLLEEEVEELQKNNDYSLEEVQNIMQDEKLKGLGERVKQAERDAIERLK